MTERPGSLAERCTVQLQDAILAGQFHPGSQLPEELLAERLDVSRNTLREAFRLLTHQQLVEHIPHRGVFVQTVDAQRSRQIYSARRVIELGTLDEIPSRALHQPALEDLMQAAQQGLAHAQVGDWHAAGKDNNQFHLAIANLTGNPLTVQMMRQLVALHQIRFMQLGDPHQTHSKYVDDNAAIAELIEAGHYPRARARLDLYLLRAEEDMA